MSEEDSIDNSLSDFGALDVAKEVEKAVDDSELEGVLENVDGDPCKSYEWSILFLLIFTASMIVMIIHMITLFKRRSMLSCIDILTVALFFATIVQFGPMLSQVLHSGHDYYHFSQTGCKLLFYTDYGMRHVVTFIVVSFFLYAYLILFHSFDSDNLDGKMRGNVAWFFMLLFAIEGLFGMPAAIYVDVGPSSVKSCVWTSTMSLSMEKIVSLELILRPLTPYLIPSFFVAVPMFFSTRAVSMMEESTKKNTIFYCLLISGSYFALNFLYAILLVAESVGHLTDGFKDFSWITVCNLKWAFFLLHQSWFLVAPICIITLESGKGNKPPGSDIAISVFNSARRQFNTRMVRMA